MSGELLSNYWRTFGIWNSLLSLTILIYLGGLDDISNCTLKDYQFFEKAAWFIPFLRTKSQNRQKKIRSKENGHMIKGN